MNKKTTFPPYEMLPTLVNRVAEKIVAMVDRLETLANVCELIEIVSAQVTLPGDN